jgi:hypothetical protein
MPAPTSLRTRLVASLLGAFVFGGVAGGAVVWLAARRGLGPFGDLHAPRSPGRPPDGPPPGRPEDMPVRLADKLSDELSLEPALRESVRQIFRDGFAESEPVRRRMGEEMKAHFSRQNDKIRALLTPEQQARFEELLAGWERHHRSGGPPPR